MKNAFHLIDSDNVIKQFPSQIKYKPAVEFNDIAQGKYLYEQRIQLEKNYLKKYDSVENN